MKKKEYNKRVNGGIQKEKMKEREEIQWESNEEKYKKSLKCEGVGRTGS